MATSVYPQPNLQPNSGPHFLSQTTYSRSPSKTSNSRISKTGQHTSRRRCWLGFGAILVLSIMCLGVVFVAHHYYRTFGGQGFLKARNQTPTSKTVASPRLYLPLRKIEVGKEDISLDSGWARRSPMEVPFYACGDQQNSCEAYNQPDICCPVGMVCHRTSYTASKIFCCDSIEPTLLCEASWTSPPKCLHSTFQCPEIAGGGCCPNNSTCSPNGCVKVTESSIIGDASSIGESGTASIARPVTVTQIPAATATIVKQGEVLQNGGKRKRSIVLTLCLPYSLAWVLVCVAALMGLL